MTTVQAEKIARRKLSLLQLAQELGNVSKACRGDEVSYPHGREIVDETRAWLAQGQAFEPEGLLSAPPSMRMMSESFRRPSAFRTL